MHGDRGLLAAVLLSALDDLSAGGPGATLAAAWIDNDGENDPFAFLRVCESLDLSPAQVRRAAQRRRRTRERSSTPQ
jgi:hypothetical protein